MGFSISLVMRTCGTVLGASVICNSVAKILVDVSMLVVCLAPEGASVSNISVIAAGRAGLGVFVVDKGSDGSFVLVSSVTAIVEVFHGSVLSGILVVFSDTNGSSVPKASVMISGGTGLGISVVGDLVSKIALGASVVEAFAVGSVAEGFSVFKSSVIITDGTVLGVSFIFEVMSTASVVTALSTVGDILVTNSEVTTEVSSGSDVFASVAAVDGIPSVMIAGAMVLGPSVGVDGVNSAVDGLLVSKGSVTTNGGTGLGSTVVDGIIISVFFEGSLVTSSVVTPAEPPVDVSVAGVSVVFCICVMASVPTVVPSDGLGSGPVEIIASVMTTGGIALASSVTVEGSNSTVDGALVSKASVITIGEKGVGS